MDSNQKELIEGWIVNLESGKYKQAKGTLCLLTPEGGVKGYCCLGVFAETNQARVNPQNLPLGVKSRPDGNYSTGPEDIYENIRFAFPYDDIVVRNPLTDNMDSIVNVGIQMNDNEYSFKQIAAMLRRVLNGDGASFARYEEE